MRIPLPAFYFDGTRRDQWVVVDGLQRLTALSRFLLSEEELARLFKGSKPLKLKDLEFLRDLEGKYFQDLPRPYQRTIEETQITAYLIDEGTPPEVKFNVFKRINTGGLPLSAQEIRHALNQGAAADLLERLAKHEAFRAAIQRGISGKRMADRECVLRFCAFRMKSPREYPVNQDFDYFLSERMREINQLDDPGREDLAGRFVRAMNASCRILEKHAFRKRREKNATRFPINKALFEAWSVNLDMCDDDQLDVLVARKDELQERFIALCNTQKFDQAVSQGTGDVARVKYRFAKIHDIIKEVLE